jgi:hypothetical protein
LPRSPAPSQPGFQLASQEQSFSTNLTSRRPPSSPSLSHLGQQPQTQTLTLTSLSQPIYPLLTSEVCPLKSQCIFVICSFTPSSPQAASCDPHPPNSAPKGSLWLAGLNSGQGKPSCAEAASDCAEHQEAPGTWIKIQTPRPELLLLASSSNFTPELRPSQAWLPSLSETQKTCPGSPPTRSAELGSSQVTGAEYPPLFPHLSCGYKWLGRAKATHSWIPSPNLPCLPPSMGHGMDNLDQMDWFSQAGALETSIGLGDGGWAWCRAQGRGRVPMENPVQDWTCPFSITLILANSQS